MQQRGARPEHEPGVDVLTSPGARAWAATYPPAWNGTAAAGRPEGGIAGAQPTGLAVGRGGQSSGVRRNWLRRALRPASVRAGRGRGGAVQAAREDRIRAPLPPPGRVVICLSATGGVGATTTAALLGQRWASLRSRESVVAVDAHSSTGSLARRTAGECGWTVREAAVAGARQQPELVVRDGFGLDVLSGDVHRDRAAVTGEELRRAMAALRGRYALVVLDVGTACGDVRGVALAEADAVVLNTGPARDQIPPALDLVDQLRAQYTLPPGRVVICLRDGTSGPEHSELRDYLAGLCRAVVPAPHDPALATGAAICPDELHPATQAARDELAATVTDALISNEERTP